MQLIFFIKSTTVNTEKFNIKDIPGSSGRLDVISRCILSALISDDGLETNVQIWVFLDKYGTFIFDSDAFNKDNFPISEITFSDYFVQLIVNKVEKRTTKSNPLSNVIYSKLDFFEELKKFKNTGYKLIALNETGENFRNVFLNISLNDKLIFIIGDQTGEIVNTNELKDLNVKNMSLGHKSYLASSVILLIKLNLRLLVA